MSILHNKITKIVSGCVVIIFVFWFGSWTTNQTLKQNLNGYKNYTISQIISNELDKEGGVNQQLKDIKDIVIDTKKSVDSSNTVNYSLYIADITKYYHWAKAGEVNKLSSDFNVKMSIYWAALPENKKTDIVKQYYTYAFNYISEHCK